MHQFLNHSQFLQQVSAQQVPLNPEFVEKVQQLEQHQMEGLAASGYD